MIKITSIPNFKEWYDTVVNFEDINVDFNSTAIKVQMKDPSNSFLISSHLELPVENTCNASISIENLKTIKEAVDVYWTSDSLIFKCGITKYKTGILKDPKVDALILPELPQVKFNLVTANIPQELIKEMVKVSEREENIVFKNDGTNLLVSDDTGSIETTYENVLEHGDIPVKCIFSFSYINNVIKVMKYFEKVTLKVGYDMPIIIELRKPGFSIDYWIAPRIED